MTDHPEPVAVTAVLLPCPWCGGPAYPSAPSLGRSYWSVLCDHCAAEGPTAGASDEGEAEAIAAWNRRTPPPTDAAPVSDTFGALTTALYDLDNTARLSDNPGAVPAARDRAKTLLDWMRRHGVTVVPLRADDDALGKAVERVRSIAQDLALEGRILDFDDLELTIARAQSGDVRDLQAKAQRARDLSIMLGRFLPGSEWFSAVGDEYYIDPKLAGDELDKRRTALHEARCKLFAPAPPATDEGK